MSPEPHTLVFVGGLHRSGTSLLSRCLAQHPAVSAFRDTGVPEDEGQHLQDVYLPAHRHGGPGRFAFDPAAHLTESSPAATSENASRLFQQWSRYWDLARPLLLEKSPPNLIRGRFLQALFPDSRFVFIVRHPVAVSLATQKWSRTTLSSLLRHWLAAHRRMERDASRLRHCTVVRYEALVADAQGTIDGITASLGLPPHPIDPAVRVVADLNAAYFAEWRRRRRGWSGLYLRLLERLYARSLRPWGYGFSETLS